MFKCKYLRSFFYLCCLSVVVSSCGMMNQADKTITATLEFENDSIDDEEKAFGIDRLMRRIKPFDKNLVINSIPNSNQISLELSTSASEARVKRTFEIPGYLEFYEVHPYVESQKFLFAINDFLKPNPESEENPFFEKLAKPGYQGGPVWFEVLEMDTAAVGAILRRNDVLNLLGSEKRYTKFYWGLKNKMLDQEVFPIYLVSTNKLGNAMLDGSVIKNAAQTTDQVGRVAIDIQMNEEGAQFWEEMTGFAFQNQTQIAMVIDNVVYTAPGVVSGSISGGRSQITGDFTLEEAQDLAGMLSNGAIPKLKIKNWKVQPLK